MKNFLGGMVKIPYGLDNTMQKIAPGTELQTNAIAAQSQPLVYNMSRYDFQEAEDHWAACLREAIDEDIEEAIMQRDKLSSADSEKTVKDEKEPEVDIWDIL